MSRKRWSPIVVVSACLLVLTGIPVFMSQRAQATSIEQQTTPTYFNYSVKFVCGTLRAASGLGEKGEPPVKPGNYATEINIHNYTYRDVGIRKKLLILVGQPENMPPNAAPKILGREPRYVQPRAIQGKPVYDTIILPPDTATMDDCNRIWQLIYPTGTPLPSAYPLTIGYLVLISRVDLDVDAVYTSQAFTNLPTTNSAGTPGSAPFFNGMAMDVERVDGKRVQIPDAVFPGPLIP